MALIILTRIMKDWRFNCGSRGRFTTKPTGHTWHADYIFHYTQGEVTLQKYVVTIRSLCCRATRRTVKTQYAIYTHYTACHVKLSDEDLSRYLNKMELV